MNAFLGRIVRSLSVPVLGSLRYLLTLGLVCGLWWHDAHLLNSAFDANLALIKGLGTAVDATGRLEAAMRAFAAEKMLLFTEASILVWTVGRIIAWPLGLLLRHRRRSAGHPPPPAASGGA